MMHPTAERIVRTLRAAKQEIHTKEVAARLDITRHTAAKYLSVLEAREVVACRSVGNAKLWRIRSEASSRFMDDDGSAFGSKSDCNAFGTVFEEEHPPLTDTEAVVEANRCLQCGGPLAPAPCVDACPTGIDVPGFIQQIADEQPLDAADTIFAANVLGGSCARVCPVEVLCEGACVLDEEGRRPISIGKLQRHATDQALLGGESPSPEQPEAPSRSEHVGVIGAGPAGLACAHELAERGYRVTVYERRVRPGGLVTHAIAPYKQHIEPLAKEFDRLDRSTIDFRFDTTVGEDVAVEELEQRHDAVFLGIGLGPDYQTDLPGEDLAGVWDSLDFIETLKMDGPQDLSLGGRVVVIGGGNTAIDVAREAVQLGAEDVRMVYRRTEEQMPAYAHEVEAARREGVHFEWLANPRRYLGDGRIRSVECIRMALGAPDASGRPKPEPQPGTEFVLEADTVVKAIGQRPWDDLISALDLSWEGSRVATDAQYRTDRPRFFAGGDCVNGGATVVEAVEDGKQAGRRIHRYLTGQSLEAHSNGDAAEQRASFLRREGEDPVFRYYQGNQFVGVDRAACKGCDLCINTCPADILHLDDRDKIVVDDVEQCIFCGLCEARCPDFAIWVERGNGTLGLNMDRFEPVQEVPS